MERTEEKDKRKKGRPRLDDSVKNARLNLMIPEEFKDIIDAYKHPKETRTDFVRRCIAYTCAAIDIKKSDRLLEALDKMETADLSVLGKLVRDVTGSA